MINIRKNVKENGITLVALVTTIIVLLILAGISLSISMGLRRKSVLYLELKMQKLIQRFQVKKKPSH